MQPRCFFLAHGAQEHAIPFHGHIDRKQKYQSKRLVKNRIADGRSTAHGPREAISRWQVFFAGATLFSDHAEAVEVKGLNESIWLGATGAGAARGRLQASPGVVDRNQEVSVW